MHNNSLSLLCISLMLTTLLLASESTESDSECEHGNTGCWTKEIGKAAIPCSLLHKFNYYIISLIAT